MRCQKTSIDWNWLQSAPIARIAKKMHSWGGEIYRSASLSGALRCPRGRRMEIYERQTTTRSAIRRGVREVPILEESRRHRKLPPIRSNLPRICHLWAMADNEAYRLVRAVEGEGMSDDRIFNVYVKPLGRGNWRETLLRISTSGTLRVGMKLRPEGTNWIMRIVRIVPAEPQATVRILP